MDRTICANESSRGRGFPLDENMMQMIGRSTVALAVTALALFTTAAVPGDATATIATAPATCGTAGMAICEEYTDAECIVSVGGQIVIRDDRCDWESQGCGPE